MIPTSLLRRKRYYSNQRAGNETRLNLGRDRASTAALTTSMKPVGAGADDCGTLGASKRGRLGVNLLFATLREGDCETDILFPACAVGSRHRYCSTQEVTSRASPPQAPRVVRPATKLRAHSSLVKLRNLSGIGGKTTLNMAWALSCRLVGDAFAASPEADDVLRRRDAFSN